MKVEDAKKANNRDKVFLSIVKLCNKFPDLLDKLYKEINKAAPSISLPKKTSTKKIIRVPLNPVNDRSKEKVSSVKIITFPKKNITDIDFKTPEAFLEFIKSRSGPNKWLKWPNSIRLQGVIQSDLAALTVFYQNKSQEMCLGGKLINEFMLLSYCLNFPSSTGSFLWHMWDKYAKKNQITDKQGEIITQLAAQSAVAYNSDGAFATIKLCKINLEILPGLYKKFEYAHPDFDLKDTVTITTPPVSNPKRHPLIPTAPTVLPKSLTQILNEQKSSASPKEWDLYFNSLPAEPPPKKRKINVGTDKDLS